MDAKKVLPYALAVAAIAFTTVVFLPLHAVIQGKPGTVAFAQTIVVLLLARRWGMRPAIAASVVGVIGWIYFYLPPYFEFKVTDFTVENAALLIAFIVTSITVGHLSARAKVRTEEAEAERERVKALLAEVQHQQTVRLQAEDALRRAHSDLESHVFERTRQLKVANQKLELEVIERRRAEEARRAGEGQIRSLVESNIIGIFFWDLDGTVTDANDAFLDILGYTRDDLASGKINWRQMTPPDSQTVTDKAIDEIQATGHCTPYEKEYIGKDGKPVPLLVGSTLFAGSPDKGVSFVLDLTERKRADKRIRYMAHHDALTSLPNRLLLNDRVNLAIVQAHREARLVGMLFIDLDHFKHINDSLGHEIGDRLLRAIARRLQNCVREGDSVARLGGDEFVVVLPSLAGAQDAARVAEKVLTALSRQILIRENELHVSGSVGISLYPQDGGDTESLMRAADIAMYHAKESGRNNFQFFTPTLNDVAHARHEMANQLHQALERDEFVLHYQPQVEVPSGRIIAVEALTRWRRPDGKLVPCGEFLKVAEETGLILPIGEWALRQACEQLKQWRGNGFPDLRMAVNLSPQQLRELQFGNRVSQILSECGLPGNALELEITENVLVPPNPENTLALERLFVLGVQISLDDFGMGYSSLAYLQRFPVHALKIDRSFVNGIGRNHNDTAIVDAVIAMGHSLHLRVVAEGVETEDQLAFLENHHCSAVQGFYYSQALPSDRVTEMLHGTRTAA